MRWAWIDRFIEFKSGQSAKAVKSLSIAEDYLASHFPGYPVMPATLMIEGLAQTGGLLVGEADDFKDNVVLAKVPTARFFREVFAGEEAIYEVELVSTRPEGASVKGRIVVDGDLVGEAEIFFAKLSPARTQELFGQTNFVFGGELQRMVNLVKAMIKKPQPPLQESSIGK
ncbi:MAG: 3-hydroxyacyl-ACP dehydratase FabZ family protein [Gemmataceae bacterium]